MTCNGTQTHNHLVRKRTLNHLAKLANLLTKLAKLAKSAKLAKLATLAKNLDIITVEQFMRLVRFWEMFTQTAEEYFADVC